MNTNHYLKEELYALIKTDESLFDFIQESSLDGLWYWDLEHPDEEWMNPKFWAVLGYDHRKMLHKAAAWQDIIHPEDLKLATENFIKHCENPEYPYDQTVRYTHKNGSIVWIRCRGLAIRDKHGKPIRMLGAHQEITELKHKEELLQKNTDLLHHAQQLANIGCWELDLSTNEVVWTEELFKIYGLDPKLPAPLYTEQEKLFPPQSWQLLASAVSLAQEQGIPYELELNTISEDGRHGWIWLRGEAVFDEHKNIIGLRGVAQDISEKKTLELEKEALIKRLNYALDASGDGIWDWTPFNGITVYSKAWIEMLGYKVGEIPHLASEWSDRLHPDDAQWVFAAITKVTQTPENGDAFSHEYRFRNKVGEYLWILNRAKVVERNEQGEATRVVGTHTDITEQKRKESEIAAISKEITDITAAVNESSAVAIVDAQGILTKVNKRLCELSGHTEKELIGQNQKILFAEGHDAEFSRNQKEVITAGNAWKGEIIKRKKNGTKYWVSAVIKPTFDDSGMIDRYIIIAQDITDRKKTELTLQESEKKFRQLFENLIDEVHLWKLIKDKTGKITGWRLVDANPPALKSWGKSINEVQGKTANEIFGEDAHVQFLPVVEEIFKTYKPYHWESYFSATDQHLYMESIPFGEYFISTGKDITEQKQSEQALLKSKRLLKEMGTLANVGGWEVDLTDNQLFWTDETFRIYGLPTTYEPKLDEAINYYAPEARPIIQAAVEHAISSGDGWDLELPFIQADGTRIWVRALGEVEFDDSLPVRLVGAFQDITEIVQQRKQIESINSRMALATDSGGIGVWEYNLQSDVLIWDEQMYKIYGASPAESEHAYALWAKHLHPDDKDITEAKLNDAIAGNSQFDTEFRVIWDDGSTHYLRAFARVIKNDAGLATKVIGVNWDITPQRELADELAQQHELMQVTLQSIGDAVITTDAEGITQWLNPVAEKLTAWSLKEAIGVPLSSVFSVINEDSRLPVENSVSKCLHKGALVESSEREILVSLKGHEYAIEDSAAPILNKVGDLIGVVLVFRDVSVQRRLNDEMTYKASHDSLTGLINRVEFEVRLRRLLKKTHQEHSQHALMFIDLDQFKIVNDTCGHGVGDELLQQVARILSETVRVNDTVARLGGDEFCIILESCTIEHAQHVGQKICDILEDFRFMHDEHRFRVGTSIGLVAIDDSWDDISHIIQAADTACYAAKEAGKNRVHTWFAADTTTQARHSEKQWATRIEKALDENRFILHAQLISKLESQETGVYAEVLVRMLDTDGSIIFPGEFLPAAERYKLAMRIDRWVLRNAINWLTRLGGDEPQINMLFINLSGQSVGDRAFHMQACEIFSQAGKAICEQICVEITETAAVTNMADASSFIAQLKELGVTVALDDFGAGAASFGYLKHLKIDILKVDGQFIRDLLDDPLDDVAVRFFIEVARVMNIKTVAEFVDQPEVLERIKELGIDYAQGFLLHKPEPIDAVLTQAYFPPRLKITG